MIYPVDSAIHLSNNPGLAPIVQRLDNAIHWIVIYLVDRVIHFLNWGLVCENVTGIPRPFDQLPLHMGKVNTFETPEMHLYFDSDV